MVTGVGGRVAEQLSSGKLYEQRWMEAVVGQAEDLCVGGSGRLIEVDELTRSSDR